MASASERLKARTKKAKAEAAEADEPKWENVTDTMVPRRAVNGGEGGPYIYPPGAEFKSGRKKCETCGRMVAADRKFPRKGSCKCFYYKRTTTFIDVLQDEFLLKQWGKRNVAWGMSQRPDLVLHAASCKPDSDPNQSDEDKRDLNLIAKAADDASQHMRAATIGTSLHKLTHSMDRGETLGYVPDPWGDDLKAYDEKIKSLGIEWVSVEAFRVFDGWMKDIKDCDHKPTRYGGSCQCVGVAGTVDRIGWYNGRLRVFDIKTGSDFNKLGHAMQLRMYAGMVPYQYPGDTRGSDPDEVDLDVGYIIYLPEGKGQCRIKPFDLKKGWQAIQVAKLVWEMRNLNVEIDEADDTLLKFTEMAGRAGSLRECRVLWENGKELGVLDKRAKAVLLNRVEELKAQGVTE